MIKLFFYEKNLLNEYQLFQPDIKTGKPLPYHELHTTEKEAAAARDAKNVDILLDHITALLCKYGGKLNYYFTGNALKQAKLSKQEIQEFVTRCNVLKKKGEASAVFVWHLLDEYVVHNIGNLQHSRTPYANDYKQVFSLINEFLALYPQPIFETPTPYTETPAMREFYAR